MLIRSQTHRHLQSQITHKRSHPGSSNNNKHTHYTTRIIEIKIVNVKRNDASSERRTCITPIHPPLCSSIHALSSNPAKMFCTDETCRRPPTSTPTPTAHRTAVRDIARHPNRNKCTTMHDDRVAAAAEQCPLYTPVRAGHVSIVCGCLKQRNTTHGRLRCRGRFRTMAAKDAAQKTRQHCRLSFSPF